MRIILSNFFVQAFLTKDSLAVYAASTVASAATSTAGLSSTGAAARMGAANAAPMTGAWLMTWCVVWV